MNLEEKELSGKNIYSGKIVKLNLYDIQLPDGKKAYREVVRHSGGAAVLYVKDGKVLLVKQYRFPYKKVLYEIPAGKISAGEDPLNTAKRELEEETGFIAQDLKKLLEVYPSPGYTDEIIYIYLTENAVKGKQCLDEGEFINCCFLSFNEVLCLIEKGEICDSKTVSAVYKYLYDIKIK